MFIFLLLLVISLGLDSSKKLLVAAIILIKDVTSMINDLVKPLVKEISLGITVAGLIALVK